MSVPSCFREAFRFSLCELLITSLSVIFDPLPYSCWLFGWALLKVMMIALFKGSVFISSYLSILKRYLSHFESKGLMKSFPNSSSRSSSSPPSTSTSSSRGDTFPGLGGRVQSRPTLGDPVDCRPAKLLCPWNFPGKNPGAGCHFLFLLQGIFPTRTNGTRASCVSASAGRFLTTAPPSSGAQCE